METALFEDFWRRILAIVTTETALSVEWKREKKFYSCGQSIINPIAVS